MSNHRSLSQIEFQDYLKHKHNFVVKDTQDHWFLAKYNSGTKITVNHILAFLDDHPWKHTINPVDNTELEGYEQGPMEVLFNGKNIVQMICEHELINMDVLIALQKHCSYWFYDAKYWKSSHTCFIDYTLLNEPANPAHPYIALFKNPKITMEMKDYITSEIAIPDNFDMHLPNCLRKQMPKVMAII